MKRAYIFIMFLMFVVLASIAAVLMWRRAKREKIETEILQKLNNGELDKAQIEAYKKALDKLAVEELENAHNAIIKDNEHETTAKERDAFNKLLKEAQKQYTSK